MNSLPTAYRLLSHVPKRSPLTYYATSPLNARYFSQSAKSNASSFPPTAMKLSTKVAIGVVSLVTWKNVHCRVRDGHVGVVEVGDNQASILPPGHHWKNPFHNLTQYPVQLKYLKESIPVYQGNTKYYLNVGLQYRIDVDQVQVLHRRVGKRYKKSVIEASLHDALSRVSKASNLSSKRPEELASTSKEMKEFVTAAVEKYGIVVENLVVLGTSFDSNSHHSSKWCKKHDSDETVYISIGNDGINVRGRDTCDAESGHNSEKNESKKDDSKDECCKGPKMLSVKVDKHGVMKSTTPDERKLKEGECISLSLSTSGISIFGNNLDSKDGKSNPDCSEFSFELKDGKLVMSVSEKEKDTSEEVEDKK